MNTGFLGPAVATVLTVYGIETVISLLKKLYNGVATVLTVYGIETTYSFPFLFLLYKVATVLTVYGIETRYEFIHRSNNLISSCNSTYRLRY